MNSGVVGQYRGNMNGGATKRYLPNVEQYVLKEMRIWEDNNFDNVITYLSRECSFRDNDPFMYVKIDPRTKSKDDYGYVFLGPNDILLAEIRWRRSDGSCTDLLVYDDNIIKTRRYIINRRAKAKSVNRNLEEKERRRQSFERGIDNFTRFVSKNYKKVLGAAAVIALIGLGMVLNDKLPNDNYINDSYNYGIEAVRSETHRTYDNDGYWYDYYDIAARFDNEKMDFDSYIFGIYNNVGWDQCSRLDCMDSVFHSLNSYGYTEFSTFFDYCNARGFCVEKDGELVIDTSAFSSATRDYMEHLNCVEDYQNFDRGIGRT